MSVVAARAAALALSLAVAVAGCTVAPTGSVPAVLHRYVVLGPDGVAVARAITVAASCPALDLDGAVRTMGVRMAPATVPQRPTRSTPELSKPSAFPVLTCESVVPPGTRQASIAGVAVPVPKANPQRIVVIGDTGCRIKVSDKVFQDCNDPGQWPFARVAQAAAATAPDLVLHVGDFHYRENACPPNEAGCAGSPWGYGYDAWNADLFTPARALLEAAPWVVVRGNHESCARAGQGWWRFLDPRPVAVGQDCNDPKDDATGDYSAPYAVPLDARGDAQFVVFDSSLVPIAALRRDDAMFRIYRAQLADAFALAARRPHSLFVNHHPVRAFAANPANAAQPYPGNAALQSVLESLQPMVLFPPTVQAVLAGHNHVFEVVSFASGQPPQIVAGHGGDWLDPPLRLPLAPGLSPAPGAVVAAIVASSRFGFLTLERAGAGWALRAYDRAGAPLGTCELGDRSARCTPDPLP